MWDESSWNFFKDGIRVNLCMRASSELHKKINFFLDGIYENFYGALIDVEKQDGSSNKEIDG